MFDSTDVFERIVDRGDTMLRQLNTLAGHGDRENKILRPVGIEEAARLVGCTTNHIRNLEKRGELPAQSYESKGDGSFRRRVYSLRDINLIREVSGRIKQRPAGSEAITLTVSNLKGGVAKTTTAVHLAQFLAREGYRVLLIDAAPEAMATSGFGYIPDLDIPEDGTLAALLTGETQSCGDIVRSTYWHQLDLIPARLDLQNLEHGLAPAGDDDSALVLERRLGELKSQYDMVIIDTPPTLGMLTINAIMAADYLLVPMSAEMYDISSSVQYFRILRSIDKSYTLRARKMTIVLTHHSERKNKLMRLLYSTYGECLLPEIVHHCGEVTRANAQMRSVYELEPTEGPRSTYKRAVEMFNAVNQAILSNVAELWEEESNGRHATQSTQSKHSPSHARAASRNNHAKIHQGNQHDH